MNRTSSTIRRTAATVALAGAAAFATVALAPVASAAQAAAQPSVDGGSYTEPGKGKGGPSYFLVTENSRKPIFFFDGDKPKKQHKVAQDDPETAPDRF